MTVTKVIQVRVNIIEFMIAHIKLEKRGERKCKKRMAEFKNTSW